MCEIRLGVRRGRGSEGIRHRESVYVAVEGGGTTGNGRTFGLQRQALIMFYFVLGQMFA